jgi:hypothetical protein
MRGIVLDWGRVRGSALMLLRCRLVSRMLITVTVKVGDVVMHVSRRMIFFRKCYFVNSYVYSYRYPNRSSNVSIIRNNIIDERYTEPGNINYRMCKRQMLSKRELCKASLRTIEDMGHTIHHVL